MGSVSFSPPQNEFARLLVIDDDRVNRELLRRLFESEYQVETAGSGQEGLAVLAHHPVDVVLLDIMMPGMNGFAVLEQIRGNPETADIPVILVSAMTDTDSVVRGLQSGANDYLTKPINLHIARARLRTQVKLKRLLDERKQAITQLEQLNELRERFFRIASHDLKNPLSNLRLAYYELNRYLPDNPDVAVIQAAMETTLDDMQTIIEDFIDVAALHNGHLELDINSVSIEECVRTVVKQFDPSAANKDITLRVGDLDGVVLADKQRLIQVISNLVSNAIKFSPRRAEVCLWTEQHGSRARLYVADHGPGIRPEDQMRLFKEFARLSNRPTGGEASTGLGLWIVKHLMTLLNGDVGFEANPEGGSIFWIELPAQVPVAV